MLLSCQRADDVISLFHFLFNNSALFLVSLNQKYPLLCEGCQCLKSTNKETRIQKYCLIHSNDIS